MNALKKKLNKNGGFTLVEMLIVVAIIAILIAISIPLVNAALEKSRHAVDDANARDAVALGTIKYLTEDNALGFSDTNTKVSLPYVVTNDKQGELGKAGEQEAVKAQCSGVNGSAECPNAGKYLWAEISSNGTVKAVWGTSATAAP